MATYDLTVQTPSSIAAGDVLNCPYSGASKNIELPPGKYKLEVWGAQGGYRSSSAYGGLGGYSVGALDLTEPATVYLYSGGAGNTGKTSGGFNGGGTRSTYNGGGGGSDIRIGQDSLYARVIVAGGGGSDGAANKKGMYGGGLAGGSAVENYGTGGGGGTQTAGGTGSASASGKGTAGTYGDFGAGGKGYNASSGYAGAGGGGWYGGAGSYPDSSGDDDRGGGGGSGYIYTAVTAAHYPSGCLLNSSYYLEDASTAAGNESFISPSGTSETGHAGDGYCRITVLELAKSKDFSSLVKVDGTYKNAAAGFVKVNGEWKSVKSIFTKIDGAWKKSKKASLLGKKWKMSDNTTESMDVHFAGNKFYSYNGAYSDDGITWIKNENLNSTYAVIDAGTFLMLCCDNGVYHSTDGMNWSKKSSTIFRNIAKGDNIFIASNNSYSSSQYGIYYSMDGISWNRCYSNSQANKVVYGNGMYLANCCNYGLYKSTDGKNWTRVSEIDGSYPSIFYENSKWFVFAQNSKAFYVSTDGITWTTTPDIFESTKYECHSLAYHDGLYVSTFKDREKSILYSEDGISWFSTDLTNAEVNVVKYANGLWVAAAGTGGTGSLSNGIFYSANGKNWNQSDLTTLGAKYLTFGDNTWIVSTCQTANGSAAGIYYSKES